MRNFIVRLYGSNAEEIRESLRDSKTNRQILWGAGWGIWVPATVVTFVAWSSGVKVPFPVVCLLLFGASAMPTMLLFWRDFDRKLKESLPSVENSTRSEDRGGSHATETPGIRPQPDRHEIARGARAMGGGRRGRK